MSRRRGQGGLDDENESPRIPYLREPHYSQSLERGLAILGCFTPGRHLLGISDIAEELGMTRSTTHRYVITLVALGFMVQGAGRKYQPSVRVTDLGMSALNSTGLPEHARPYLEELRLRSGYTVSLAELDGPDVVYVDGARSLRYRQYKIDMNLHRGARLPAHCTAVGKVLWAHLPNQVRQEFLASAKLVKRGPNTITSKRTLAVELERIRIDGFAFNDEELTASLISVAVPIRNEAHEVVAAVSMSAHLSMITLEDLVNQLLPHLITTADNISARLGYRRDDEITQ